VKSTDPPSRNATHEEVCDAINALSVADSIAIDLASKSFSRGSDYEPQELINEAISRTLGGVDSKDGRHWPEDVPFVAFFIMTMMGVANDSRESNHRKRTISLEANTPPGSSVDQLLGAMSYHHPDPLSQALDSEVEAANERRAKDVLSALETHFVGDDDVSWIILGVREGKKANEIMELSGMNQTQYETARRRYRRGVAVLFPEKRLV